MKNPWSDEDGKHQKGIANIGIRRDGRRGLELVVAPVKIKEPGRSAAGRQAGRQASKQSGHKAQVDKLISQ